MGQHCPGFLRVLYDAVIRLGYDGDAPVYRYRYPPTPEPWLGSLIGSKTDTGIDMMAHFTLTSPCEDHLAATIALPIMLLPIRNQENPVWQQHLEAVLDLEGPHFHTGMTSLVKWCVQGLLRTLSSTSLRDPSDMSMVKSHMAVPHLHRLTHPSAWSNYWPCRIT
jgi:hypothetical protein